MEDGGPSSDVVPEESPPKINELYDYRLGYSSKMWRDPKHYDADKGHGFLTVKADSSLLPLDNVVLTAYYGHDYYSNYDIKPAYEITQHGIRIFNYQYGMTVDVNYTDDVFTSSKYRRRDLRNKELDIYEMEYGHSEQLVVPRELFVGNSGVLSFYCYGITTIDGKGTIGSCRITPDVNIAYRTDGETVLLAAEEYSEYVDWMPWVACTTDIKSDHLLLEQYDITYDKITESYVCNYRGDMEYVEITSSQYLLYIWDADIIIEITYLYNRCYVKNRYHIIDCYENTQIIPQIKAKLQGG